MGSHRALPASARGRLFAKHDIVKSRGPGSLPEPTCETGVCPGCGLGVTGCSGHQSIRRARQRPMQKGEPGSPRASWCLPVSLRASSPHPGQGLRSLGPVEDAWEQHLWGCVGILCVCAPLCAPVCLCMTCVCMSMCVCMCASFMCVYMPVCVCVCLCVPSFSASPFSSLHPLNLCRGEQGQCPTHASCHPPMPWCWAMPASGSHQGVCTAHTPLTQREALSVHLRQVWGCAGPVWVDARQRA